MEMTLKGIVVSKFGNASNFAKALHWSKSKAQRIVRESQTPNANDIEDMAAVLGIESAEEFIRLFFPQKSTKWINNGNGCSHENKNQSK